MGFFDNWKKNRKEKARLRQEQADAWAKKREEDAKNTAILLAVNTRIANSALRDTERERTRQLSSHYHDEVIRRIGALGQTMMRATTDMIGGSQLTRQFLGTPYRGTGEPGDFAIFCVYVSSVIKNCATLLEASRTTKANSLEGKDGTITVSHQEIVTGIDTTLASSLTRAEWLLSERKELVGDYIGGLLISAVNQPGLRFAGPIAKKALERLKASCSI